MGDGCIEDNTWKKVCGGVMMMGCFGRIRRDVKALSPIFAVLILIAIAVIAGIIIYMFTSGYLATMMGGGSAGQEKVAIETVVSNTTAVYAYCKSTGGGPVTITEAILKDSAGNTIEVLDITDVVLLADGTTAVAKCSFTKKVTGTTYTVTLVSKAGNQFVSSAFKG